MSVIHLSKIQEDIIKSVLNALPRRIEMAKMKTVKIIPTN